MNRRAKDRRVAAARHVARCRRGQRRGAAIVEGAVVLSAVLVLLFFMLDAGLAVVRYNVLSSAARAVARVAIVRGGLAAPEKAAWGPQLLTTNAAANVEAAITARPLLATLDPSKVAIAVEWPDGDNEPGDRVRVVVTYTHVSSVPLATLPALRGLRAACTMRIVH